MTNLKISLAGITLAFGALLAPNAFGYSGDKKAAAPEGAVMQGYESYNTAEKLGWYYMMNDGSTTFSWTDKNSLDASTLLFGWMKDDRICAVSSKLTQGRLYYYQYLEIDPATGEYYEAKDIIPIVSGQQINYLLYYNLAAYIPSDNRIYGYGYDENGSHFVFKSSKPDFTDTRVIREIEDSEFCLSLTYNEATGALIGFNGASFVQIDPLSGRQTSLYTPTFTTPYQRTYSALAYDRASNKYYWNYFTTDQKSHLATVDFNARQFNVIKDYDDMTLFTVLLPMPQTVDPDAPGQAVFNDVDFNNGATSGSVTFTLPEEKVAGKDFKWTLRASGVQVATGSGKPNEKVTVNLNDLQEGAVLFSVVVELDGHLSLPADYQYFIGIDTPATPQNVQLSGTTLSWDAVTVGRNGGYVNAEQMKYNVYLSDQLQGTTSDTTFEITYPAGIPYTGYQASVIAVDGEKESLPAFSNIEHYGESLSVPVTFAPTVEQAALFTVADVDGNGNEWTLDTSNAQRFTFVSGYSNTKVDEWLFLPPLDAVDAETVYQIQIRAGLQNDNDSRALFDIKAGTAASPEAMTYSILSDVVLSDSKARNYVGLFNPSQSLAGVDKVVIGIRANAPNGGAQISVRNFQITKTNISPEAPAAVTAYRIAPAPKGELSADISFRLPTKNLKGETYPEGTELSAVVRGDNTVTLKGAPGEQLKTTIKAYEGLNEFSVTPKFNDLSGQVSKAEVYCGVDRPGGVTGMKIVVAEDNMSATATWEAPELGMNGGYVDPAAVTYDVCLYNSATGEYEPFVNIGTETSYTLVPSTDTLGNYRFAIQSNTTAGATSYLAGERVQLGKPYDLPITENFIGDGGKAEMHYAPYTLVTTEAFANTAWEIGNPANIRPEYDNPTGVALIGNSTANNSTGFFEFPKFTTADKMGVKFIMQLYRGKSAPIVKVYAQSSRMEEYELVETVPASDEAGYQNIIVSLPDEKFADAGWVSVYMSPEYASTMQSFVMTQFAFRADQDSVEETLAHNLILTTGKGTLTIDGAEGEIVEIFSASGMTVARFTAAASHTVQIPAGIYVVRIAGTTLKTAVR